MKRKLSNTSGKLRVPHPRSRRALLIIDVEPTFITPLTRRIVRPLARLIVDGGYSVIVTAEHTKGPVRSRGLTRRRGEGRSDETITEIADLLDPHRTFSVPKATRSIFGNGSELATTLRRRRITHVHIVGLETHDCVLASTLDAFDHGFVTCAIERACASKRGADHSAALHILRRMHLTDRSLRL
jgi:nicotinamidase-related amidase